MQLPLTRELLPEVQWLESTPSTNASMRELVAERVAAGDTAPHGMLLTTSDQTAGRGRQGRGWETPPGTALASTLLVRPDPAAIALGRLGQRPDALSLSWLPLLAGSAVARALQPLFRDQDGEARMRVGVKWPNDVHVRDEEEAMAGKPGAKLCGILCEVLPSGEIAVGFGVNVLLEDWQLPTERAGSVLACGGNVGGAVSITDPLGEVLADEILSTASREVLALIDQAAKQPASARTRVLRDSLTLGAEVRVHLPGGELVDGRAVGLADDGALIVDRPTLGQLVVNAADVEHLR